jgi:transposase IS481 family protein
MRLSNRHPKQRDTFVRDPTLCVIRGRVVDERESRAKVVGCPPSDPGKTLVVHGKAGLNILGRKLRVTRAEPEGSSVAESARPRGVSRQPAHCWVDLYRTRSWPGLNDRGRRRNQSPKLTASTSSRSIFDGPS